MTKKEMMEFMKMQKKNRFVCSSGDLKKVPKPESTKKNEGTVK